ncbi:hypothetical protein ADK57_26640 [Streptomyces sp. MMG1533]|nr:hypothetical protein ADK57_26640 [Streptomyces sp. MMG1533]
MPRRASAPPLSLRTVGALRAGTRHPLCRIPDTMTAVPAVLLGGALAGGVAPGFADAVAHAVNEAGSGGAVVASSHRRGSSTADQVP